MDEPELKDCPFCGAAGEYETTTEKNGALNCVCCPDCQYSLMNGPIGIGWYPTKSDAAAAWNRRNG